MNVKRTPTLHAASIGRSTFPGIEYAPFADWEIECERESHRTTGILSSFLDNAPTYLVFFNTAGGNPDMPMTSLGAALAAKSCGAVFMEADGYVGNAPNLMVKAIAEERGIRMLTFFGYMAWSCAIPIPLFIAMTFIFFL
jgi:Na+/H+ antiporter NhaD/arsenite permease-like protein